ncbi:hypothetical protein ABEY65_28100 [Priestia aryabhattai]|uniref:DNA ligase LigA-related protein n=1 Tax=Priestia aryabhattai TaxID=412384 RepID=UPI003D2D9084
MSSEILEKMNRRQRQLLVHSFLYYQLNENIIDDSTFDLWSKELADLMAAHPKISEKSAYFEGFKTFDGSSGYDLPFHLPEIQSTGYRLIKLHRERRKH